MKNTVQVVIGKKVSREELIQTLVVEGGILFPVEYKDITDEMLLSAAVQVIDAIAEQKDKTLEALKTQIDLTNQFYRACQRINVTVSRDEKNQIKLERI